MDSMLLANEIRKLSLKMVHKAKAAHIGSSLSIADIVAVLYGSVMNYQVDKSYSELRDRFILSKGHACVAVYAALAEVGFITHDSLKTYGQDGSSLMNHISHKVDGVEFSTGSLGHGLSFGVGKALAAKTRNEKWRTYVLLSDGEMNAGSNWEALMFAAHHSLDSLVAIIDYNKYQSLDSVANTIELEPLVEKIMAFGWEVFNLDGHNHKDLLTAISAPTKGQPRLIVAHTTKGKGVSFMEDRVEWHYKNPNDEQLKVALVELGDI